MQFFIQAHRLYGFVHPFWLVTIPFSSNKSFENVVTFKILKVSIVTFVTYIYTGDDHVLTAEKAFVCLTLFDIIKLPLGMLPLVVAQMIQVIFTLFIFC